MEQLKKNYAEIQKKLGLPNFEDMDREFEISKIDIEKTPSLLREVFRNIISKLANFLSYIEPAITTPPQSLHAMIESNNIGDDDKNEMFRFYKELSSLIHKGLYVDLLGEKEISSYIKELWKSWGSVKQREIKFLKIIQESWLKEEKHNPREDYLS